MRTNYNHLSKYNKGKLLRIYQEFGIYEDNNGNLYSPSGQIELEGNLCEIAEYLHSILGKEFEIPDFCKRKQDTKKRYKFNCGKRRRSYGTKIKY